MNCLLNNFRRCCFFTYKQLGTITEIKFSKNFAMIKTSNHTLIEKNNFSQSKIVRRSLSSSNILCFDILKEVNNKLEQFEEKVSLPKELFDHFTKEYENLLKENEDLKDKYTRSIAETENVRKRMQKLIDDSKIFAVQSFCKDLLEVADILNLALDSLEKKNELSNDNLKNIHEGIKMTKNVLVKTFSKHGLLPISPEGVKFDPNFHDAIFEVPKDQSKYMPGYVHHVMKIGYCLHNRPIRPAQVSVVKQ